MPAGARVADAVDDRRAFAARRGGAPDRSAFRAKDGDASQTTVPTSVAAEAPISAGQQLVGRPVGVRDPPLGIQGEDALVDAVEASSERVDSSNRDRPLVEGTSEKLRSAPRACQPQGGPAQA